MIEFNTTYNVLQINATFKDGVLTQDVTPLKENEGKQHYVKMYVKDGELIAVSTDSISKIKIN